MSTNANMNINMNNTNNMNMSTSSRENNLMTTQANNSLSFNKI